jgi:hypothetical protein
MAIQGESHRLLFANLTVFLSVPVKIKLASSGT